MSKEEKEKNSSKNDDNLQYNKENINEDEKEEKKREENNITNNSHHKIRIPPLENDDSFLKEEWNYLSKGIKTYKVSKYAPNCEEHNQILFILPLITTTPKFILFIFLNIITIGLINLFLIWFPKLNLYIYYSMVGSISEAGYVAIFNKGGDQIIIEKLRIINQPDFDYKNEKCVVKRFNLNINFEKDFHILIMFTYRLFDYVYQKNSDDFESLDYQIKDIQRKITENYTLGLQNKEINFMKKIFGKCDIDIKIKPMRKIILEELSDPYYLFQVYSATIWYCTGHYFHASFTIAVTIISMICNIVETHNSNKKLQELSKYSCKLLIYRPTRINMNVNISQSDFNFSSDSSSSNNSMNYMNNSQNKSRNNLNSNSKRSNNKNYINNSDCSCNNNQKKLDLNLNLNNINNRININSNKINNKDNNENEEENENKKRNNNNYDHYIMNSNSNLKSFFNNNNKKNNDNNNDKNNNSFYNNNNNCKNSSYQEVMMAREMDSSELVPGDLYEIPGEGYSIPCDTILVSGSVIVNESSLTGDSNPVIKVRLPSNNSIYNTKRTISEKYILFAGTKVLQKRSIGRSQILGLVYQTGFKTFKGNLINTILYPKEEENSFSKDSFKYIIFMSILCVVGFFIALKFLIVDAKYSVKQVIFTFLDLIAITVPPSLPACISIGLQYSINRLKQSGVLCMRKEEVNRAGSVNVLVFDKTGTLTDDYLDIYGYVSVRINYDNLNINNNINNSNNRNIGNGMKSKYKFVFNDFKDNCKNDTDLVVNHFKKTVNNHLNSDINSINDNNKNKYYDRNKDILQCYMECLACCHCLTYIHGKLLGDPIDKRMFESVDWIFKEKNNSEDDNEENNESNENNDNDNFDPFILGYIGPKCEKDKKIISLYESEESKKEINNSNQNNNNNNNQSNKSNKSNASIKDRYEIGIVRRFDFSSKLSRMTVIGKNINEDYFKAFCKGSPEKVKSLCKKETIPENFNEVLNSYTTKGYRVLGMAIKGMYMDFNLSQTISRETVEKDMIFLGLLIVKNKLKENTTESMIKFDKADYRMIMSTGDNLLTSVRIGKECNLIKNEQPMFSLELEGGEQTHEKEVLKWKKIENIQIEKEYSNSNKNDIDNNDNCKEDDKEKDEEKNENDNNNKIKEENENEDKDKGDNNNCNNDNIDINLNIEKENNNNNQNENKNKKKIHITTVNNETNTTTNNNKETDKVKCLNLSKPTTIPVNNTTLQKKSKLPQPGTSPISDNNNDNYPLFYYFPPEKYNIKGRQRFSISQGRRTNHRVSHKHISIILDPDAEKILDEEDKNIKVSLRKQLETIPEVEIPEVNDTEYPLKLCKDENFGIAMTGPTFVKLYNLNERYLKNEEENLNLKNIHKIYRLVLKNGRIFARMAPEDKALLINSFKKEGMITLMCGDEANDYAALRAAHVGVSLGHEEALIAAGFTCKLTNVSELIKILKEGKCCLATSVETFKYMMLYTLIRFFCITLAMTHLTYLNDYQCLVIDIFIIFPLQWFLSRTHPYDELTYHYPDERILSLPVLSSIIIQTVIVFSFQLGGIKILNHFFKWKNICAFDEQMNPLLCHENTILFLLAVFQYLTAAISFFVSKPFRQRMYTNWLLILYLVVAYFYNIWLTVNCDKWSKKIFNIFDFEKDENKELNTNIQNPHKIKKYLLLIAGINLVVNIFFEWEIMPLIKKCYYEKMIQIYKNEIEKSESINNNNNLLKDSNHSSCSEEIIVKDNNYSNSNNNNHSNDSQNNNHSNNQNNSHINNNCSSNNTTKNTKEISIYKYHKVFYYKRRKNYNSNKNNKNSKNENTLKNNNNNKNNNSNNNNNKSNNGGKDNIFYNNNGTNNNKKKSNNSRNISRNILGKISTNSNSDVKELKDEREEMNDNNNDNFNEKIN